MNRRSGFCVLLFAALCVGVLMFLQIFMSAENPVRYITFQSVSRVEADGSLTVPPLDEFGMPEGMGDGALYRFSAMAEDIPEGGYLLLENAGAELTIRMNGETVLQSTGAASHGARSAGGWQIHVPFPPGAERCELEVDCRVLDADNALYPPLARMSSLRMADGANIAYANLYGIPAGAFLLVFVFVSGLYLLSLVRERPDHTLPVPALAAGLIGVWQLSSGCGYYFLPEALYHFLAWDGFELLALALLAVWILMSRRRGTWRQFGWSALVTCAAALCAYLISLARGGYTARYIHEMVRNVFRYGDYSGLLYWLTVFLVLNSAAIAAYGILKDFIGMETDARALALKSELTLENYRILEEKLRQTADLRHEWKNQVATLHLLQEKGDWDELARQLERLDSRLDRLAPRRYSEHMAVNTILQSAAARAETLETDFRATAPLPAELGVREEDLCSLLINMLDNALEAASRVPPPGVREVECTMRVKQGYLAIRCENTYVGPLSISKSGRIQTTKDDPDSHGFGLAHMCAIAKKHASAMDISYTDDRFTVQAALKIR